ncbi:SusC/RagA family TonB-linked outer membrane protein [Chryseobacterium sp.]|uniref:SusC/RagA family TonB-linked outer membrane protein n=1 Tax=Chryseobacterium sp. TaxID=1871047 RepID=UPI003890996B
MNSFNFVKCNRAALFFAMALLPSTMMFSQSKKNDSTTQEKKIEEVVLIGYGQQKKEAVTGSVSSLSAAALKEVPSANVTEALQGRLPGVEIGRTSTKPGSEQQIRIRGTRSLSADNNPLIVLDGIPFAGSIGDISPSDIKSMDILKDASATAIYGSRGANGVILITTNRGVSNQKAKLSYNSFTGVQTLFSKYDMMNGNDYAKLRKLANLYSNGTDEKEGMNTDWQSLFYNPAMITSHDLGLTGGGEGGSYNVGLSYFKQDGVVPLQSYQRYAMRASVDQKINSFLRFGLTSNNSYSINDGNNINPGTILGYSPLIDPYNADGTIKTIANHSIDQSYIYSREGLSKLGDAYVDQTRAFASYNNIYGELSVPGIQGLKYRMNVGANIRISDTGSYTGMGVFATNPLTQSSANISHSLMTQWVVENLLTYDRTFGKHKINAVALYSAEEQKFNRSHVKAVDVPIDAFQFYNLGHAQGEITIDPNQQNYYKRGLVSWMGRAMYQYDNKYMVTATLRSDGASVLAPGNKWHTYPAVSVGWNVTGESFMEKFTFVNLLKFRAGYGQTSNQAVLPYSTFGRLGTVPYNFGNNGTGSYEIGNYVTRLPNANLGWEYSQTYNYGVDFGFLNNRITGTVEYYNTKTNDILLDKNLPTTSGVTLVTTNVGQTQNKGLEVSLNAQVIKSENFSWDLGANFYTNDNKVTALNSGQTQDEAMGWFVGHNINSIYDYQYTGLWQAGDPYLNILEPGGNVGMIKVLYTGGYNADGTPQRAINSQDRQIIELDPDWQGGLNSRWAYKNFDLSVVAAFQHGGTLVSSLYGPSGYLNRLSGRGGNVNVDYWTPENTDAYFPSPNGVRSGDNLKYSSTLAFFDASYFKIRTITLGYNFNKNVLDNLKLSNFRIYATVQNPFVFGSPYHRLSGMDPEPNSTGTENQAVGSQYQNRILLVGTNNPSTTNFIMGLNLTF